MIKVGFIMLFCSIIVYSCGNKPRTSENDFNESDIRILVLDTEETEDKETEFEYINNRKVIRELKLESKIKEQLVKVLYDKNNYEALTRKCQLEPVYAVKIESKIRAVFDLKFCPYIQLFDEKGNQVTHQLKINNSIDMTLQNLGHVN